MPTYLVIENKSAVDHRKGKEKWGRREGLQRGIKQFLGVMDFIYSDCSDGFMSINMSQLIKLLTLNMCGGLPWCHPG